MPVNQITEDYNYDAEPKHLTPLASCEACSGFTHVMARRIARPPKAAFVTRLQSGRLPNPTARQLPDQSTIIWVEPSSTGDTRHRGALNGESYRLKQSRARRRKEPQPAAEQAIDPETGEIIPT